MKAKSRNNTQRVTAAAGWGGRHHNHAIPYRPVQRPITPSRQGLLSRSSCHYFNETARLQNALARAGVVLAAALRLDAVVHAHLLALSTPASKGWSRGEEVAWGKTLKVRVSGSSMRLGA